MVLFNIVTVTALAIGVVALFILMALAAGVMIPPISETNSDAEQTSNTRMHQSYALAHIAGVSKIAYALATPPCIPMAA